MVFVFGVVHVHDPKTNTIAEHPFRYAGKELPVFRLGLGPDGMLYGSGAMPAHFFRVNPCPGTLEELGIGGDGEFYSFLQYKKTLLGAAYVGISPLMVYDPS